MEGTSVESRTILIPAVPAINADRSHILTQPNVWQSSTVTAKQTTTAKTCLTATGEGDVAGVKPLSMHRTIVPTVMELIEEQPMFKLIVLQNLAKKHKTIPFKAGVPAHARCLNPELLPPAGSGPLRR